MKMKTIKKIGFGLVGLLSLLTVETKAQDFFNGMPGPKLTQSDNYITLDTKSNYLSGTYVQKIFPRIGENKNFLVALPIAIDNSGIDLKGINLAYMQQQIAGKEIYATFAVGAFEGPSGKLTQVIPQTYITMLQDALSVDLEGKVSFDTETGKMSERGAVTIGLGNSRLRGGASVIFQDGIKPSYQLLGRFDLTADHKYWAELYLMNDKKVGVRFAANF